MPQQLTVIGVSSLSVLALKQQLSVKLVEYSDIRSWRKNRRVLGTCLVRVRISDDPSVVSELAQSGFSPVIVMVERCDNHVVAKAILAGASAVVGEDSPLEAVLTAIESAAPEVTLLPVSVGESLAGDLLARSPPEGVLRGTDREWLQLLASGMSIEELAGHVHYDTRHVRRVLNAVYGRIGARNLKHALALAGFWGLVDDPRSDGSAR